MSQETITEEVKFEYSFFEELKPLLVKEPLIFSQPPWSEDRPERDFSDIEPQLVILNSDESHKPVNYKNCLVFRNYIHPQTPAENERPIPLPVADKFNPIDIPFLERQLVGSFSGFTGNKHRADAVKKLLEIKNTYQRIYVNVTEGFGKGLPREEYSSLMSQTMLAICPFGGSYETFRLSEALKAGCIPIQLQRPLQWYDPAKEAIWIEKWDDLPEVINAFFNTRPLVLKERSNLCKKFYETHLTPQAVANYINKEWAKYIEQRLRDTQK